MTIYQHNPVGSSETLRNESPFDFAWFAGLLDADGGLSVSRTGSISCEITMHEKEVQTLYFIKRALGGSVTRRVNKRAFRWRLHRADAVAEVLHGVNGFIQTQRVLAQLEKACLHRGIEPLPPHTLTLDSAWLAGFFSGDGSFSINPRAGFQPSASIAQKERDLLERLALFLGGRVYEDSSWVGWIWWVDLRSHTGLLEYLERWPLHNPAKQARLKSIRRFLGFLERGLHRDPRAKARLHHFVRLFQKHSSKERLRESPW